MADERDATQAAGRSSEAASTDLPDLADSGLADCHDDEASSAGWMGSGVWVGAILALLMLYFLLLPPVIIYLENKRFFDHTPSAVDTAIEVSLVPLIWLADKVIVYSDYIDWLSSKIP